jgi:dTDP-4-dehydrorhamnose reductase
LPPDWWNRTLSVRDELNPHGSTLQPLKILIVGPNGQLGQELLQAGRAAGLTVVPLDRSGLDLQRIEAIGPTLRGFEFDVLVNAAGYTAVDAAEAEPGMAFTVNAYAVEALALGCRASRARLVQVSTDYVFSGEADQPYHPADAPGPLNVYGASKLAGEALAMRAYPEGTLVVRTSSVFGLAGRPPAGGGNFVETVLRLASERGRIRVVADNTMAPTYAPDLARGLISLLGQDPAPGILHLTNRGRASWHEFASAILELARAPCALDAIPARDYPTPARRPSFSVLDTQQTTDRIGPLPSWQDALRRYLVDRDRV